MERKSSLAPTRNERAGGVTRTRSSASRVSRRYFSARGGSVMRCGVLPPERTGPRPIPRPSAYFRVPRGFPLLYFPSKPEQLPGFVADPRDAEAVAFESGLRGSGRHEDVRNTDPANGDRIVLTGRGGDQRPHSGEDRMVLEDQDGAGVPGGPKERRFIERLHRGKIEHSRRDAHAREVVRDLQPPTDHRPDGDDREVAPGTELRRTSQLEGAFRDVGLIVRRQAKIGGSRALLERHDGGTRARRV